MASLARLRATLKREPTRPSGQIRRVLCMRFAQRPAPKTRWPASLHWTISLDGGLQKGLIDAIVPKPVDC